MLNDAVRHISFLPVLPESQLRLRELLNSPEGDFNSLAEVIENDHILTATILKVGNSATYNYSGRRLTNIRDILARIGHEGLQRLLEHFPTDTETFSPEIGSLYTIWQRSFVNKSLVGKLERLSSLSFLNGEMLSLAGLLQDTGLVVRAHLFPELWKMLCEESKHHDNDLFSVESQTFGIETHGELGARLLEQWRISSEITIPVRYHENPEQAPRSFRSIAHLLHCTTALHSYAIPSFYGKRYAKDHIKTILQISGIDPVHLHELESFIHEESDRSRTVLSLWGMGETLSKLRSTGSTSLLRPV